MNEANSLMPGFEDSVARFRGLSTRHLQGHIDRFVFQKTLRCPKESIERPGTEIDAILREKTVITCREISRKAMPVGISLPCGSSFSKAFKFEG